MILYSIFKQKLANQLESLGFQVIKIEPNKKNPKYVVYKFEDTVELRKALHNIFNSK